MQLAHRWPSSPTKPSKLTLQHRQLHGRYTTKHDAPSTRGACVDDTVHVPLRHSLRHILIATSGQQRRHLW